MAICRQDIIEVITDILHKKLLLPIKSLTKDNFNESLTGEKIGLNSVGLMYLFMEIESSFKVKFDCKHFLKYEFNSINGIANLLLDLL